jgi:hypothetical protein
MAKRTGIVTKDYLVNSPIPQQTKTYTPIAHEFIINTALDSLKNKGFVVSTELYVANHNSNVAYGKYLLNFGNDPEMGMMFAWSNSYDKTMRFKCAIGAYNKNNMNAIVSAEMGNYNRIHKGNADKDTQSEILNQIANAQLYYDQLMRDKDVMKTLSIDKKQASELLGRIYLEHNLLTDEQMATVRNEVNRPTFDYNATKDSLWTFYNHILYSLQKSHPRDWMDQQTLVHWFLCKEMSIINKVIVPVVTEEEADVSPNQLSLMEEFDEMSGEDNTNTEG